MRAGEVWRLEDTSLRLVLSPETYNVSALNRVITAVVGGPPVSFDPFAVTTTLGTIYADRLAMHPRHWLIEVVGSIDDEPLTAVRAHLRFLLVEG